MVELRERLDRVLEKARFTVSVFSPVEMKTEPLGGLSTRGRSVSEEELSPKRLARLYEESRSGLRKSTWVQPLVSENDDGAMAALTGELRTVLGAFVEPNLDIVGHALHWLPTRMGFTKGVPSGLHVSQAISPVAELAEALVIAGGCLGSERACEYILAWVEGESLGYRTFTLLPDVEVGTELESDDIRIACMPHSTSELPSYVPTGHFEPVQQFLGSVVMSVDTRAGPVFNRPRGWDDLGTQVEARWVLGDWEDSLDRFCESLSLAADAHVNRSGQWFDYGDLRAFGFQHSGLGGGVRPRETTRDKVHLDQTALERAWDIHRLRMRNSKNRKPSDTAIDRWLRSMNPRARLADQLIELRVAMETLYLDGGDGELKFRLAIRGAWDLGSTPAEREAYYEILKKAYGLCSRAIHKGFVKETEPNLRVLHNAQKACRKGILKRLSHHRSPNWLPLVLGGRQGEPPEAGGDGTGFVALTNRRGP